MASLCEKLLTDIVDDLAAKGVIKTPAECLAASEFYCFVLGSAYRVAESRPDVTMLELYSTKDDVCNKGRGKVALNWGIFSGTLTSTTQFAIRLVVSKHGHELWNRTLTVPRNPLEVFDSDTWNVVRNTSVQLVKNPHPDALAGVSTACNTCGKGGIKLKKCGRCGAAFYCSKECQAFDWNDHKPVCKALSNPPAPSQT